MRMLSLYEKEKHVDKLQEFVEELNNENHVILKHSLEICHICYMIRIDDIYLYYDYPFKKESEEVINKFNSDLNNPELSISKISNATLDLFKKKDDGKGYIYYKYEYDATNRQYNLFELISNIGNENNQLTLKDYLPVVHFACSLKDSHLDPVFLSSDEKENSCHQLLTVYRPITLLNERITNTSIAISFRINNSCAFKQQNFDLEDFEKRLIKRIVRFFDSPILDKVIMEERKLELLAYQHQINGLYLYSSLQALQTNIENANLARLKEIKDSLAKKINCLNIIHDFLFQQEYLRAGYQINEATNPLLGKSIFQILSFFDKEANFTNVNIEWIGDTRKLEFCPIIKSNDGIFELSEITMLLWNLWLNATESAQKHSLNSISIEVLDENQKLGIRFSNAGIIHNDYISYLNNIIKEYPTTEKRRTMKGLEIIKNILIKNNSKWKFNVFTSERPLRTTNFTLIFNNINY